MPSFIPNNREKLTPAYDENARKSVSAGHTGCPCPVKLARSITITTRDTPDEVLSILIKNSINQWVKACDNYEQGSWQGTRTQENWDRQAKLPYGKTVFFPCVNELTSIDEVKYCRLSQKKKVVLNSRYKILKGQK